MRRPKAAKPHSKPPIGAATKAPAFQSVPTLGERVQRESGSTKDTPIVGIKPILQNQEL